ncbi:phage major capsid protein [Comamonas sp. JC664]|uniref:phage major capsid protein n=1 Tax=Comamonas sp. JC664 TaxID=2801917 RepID=UPI00174CC4A3|nr:phage major capsid protein [Comamonas sp. JC664]MBL0698943.1 phage major capsid protein [Comamonas sp. JC664]
MKTKGKSSTKNKSTTSPRPAAPAALPQVMETAINKAATIAVEAAIASRPAPAAAHAPITGKDLQLDLSQDTRQKRLYAALGLRLKSAYLGMAGNFGLAKEEKYKNLGAFLERTKAAGQFVSIFDQFGAFARETVSSELVELCRPNSILMAAGIRTVSDYGAQLTMGTIDEGVKVHWVGEGDGPPVSTMKGGRLVLQAHKLSATGRLSNDLLRLGTIDSAAVVGEDMAAAIALEIDTVGLKGDGVAKPKGVRGQMDQDQRKPTAGGTTTNKIADTDGLLADVSKANIPGGVRANRGFYYSDTETFHALKQTRDNAGWVFPELRDSETPTINGRPYFYSETLAGDDVLGFGLAAQLILGIATPLEVAMGENGTDFSADMITMRGITLVDFLLRYKKAFAERTGMTY